MDLVKETYKKYIEAKKRAQMECEELGETELARKIGECRMFKGSESVEQLAMLAFTGQGIEFMLRFGFPDIATFRKFKKYGPERYGVYIDCGEIALEDSRNVLLVGETTATLKYSRTQGNRMYMLHGASAKVDASRYAVLKVARDESSVIEIRMRENAIVLR